MKDNSIFRALGSFYGTHPTAAVCGGLILAIFIASAGIAVIQAAMHGPPQVPPKLPIASVQPEPTPEQEQAAVAACKKEAIIGYPMLAEKYPQAKPPQDALDNAILEICSDRSKRGNVIAHFHVSSMWTTWEVQLAALDKKRTAELEREKRARDLAEMKRVVTACVQVVHQSSGWSRFDAYVDADGGVRGWGSEQEFYLWNKCVDAKERRDLTMQTVKKEK